MCKSVFCYLVVLHIIYNLLIFVPPSLKPGESVPARLPPPRSGTEYTNILYNNNYHNNIHECNVIIYRYTSVTTT